ncbi:nucleotide exchange factor GrpE [Arthrobacter parietis]|uniref:Protein GrpE n=2 Tax=Arthrobacter TaxID=1663 RepID=A0ABT6CRP2_9MICC|nr:MULTISPECIES: nucleotide exchange factor GrpE [Arthrobacter]KRF08180.1 molecular chaperone GrpE [Arthrobacter sp. Soil782]MDF9276728.1 nucleotide exchange factor GrpE [Arthrobacter vasquezii]
MPHHGNEEEHQEPVSFRDNRKIDPETGQVRGQQDAGGTAGSDDTGSAPSAGAGQESEAPTDGPADGQDALAQAEVILNEAGGGEEVPAASTDVEAELRNDFLRLQAEYVNYRKRVERDRDVARDMAVIGVLNSLMPVLDDIDAARQHGDLADGPFAAISTKLENALKTYGLSRIDETGVEFDPNIHEALIQQPSAEVQFDSVSQILRVGYKKNDRVLRAAQVIVAVPE